MESDVILSNCFCNTRRLFPVKGMSERILGSSVKILKVIDLDLCDVVGADDDAPINVQYSEEISCRVSRVWKKIRNALEGQHEENASIYGSPSKKILVANLIGYPQFIINGIVQIACHDIIQGRSPHYLFNLEADRERYHQAFLCSSWRLECNRDFIILEE